RAAPLEFAFPAPAAHTVAPTATRCSRLPANDDWVPAVGSAHRESDQESTVLERRVLSTATRILANGDRAPTALPRLMKDCPSLLGEEELLHTSGHANLRRRFHVPGLDSPVL